MTAQQWKYRNEFLNSKEWRRIRFHRIMAQRKIHGFDRCECCQVPFVNKDWKNLHHVTYPSNWYETTTDQIRLVCVKCHQFIHRLLDQKKLENQGDVDALWVKTVRLSAAHSRELQKAWNERMRRRLLREAKAKQKERTEVQPEREEILVVKQVRKR